MQKTIFLIFTFMVGIFSFNPKDQPIITSPGTLYTLANVSLQLGTIDPQSGKINPFGPGYDSEIISFQLTAIDYVNQLFYAVAFDADDGVVYLVSLELTTGKLKYKIALPFQVGLFLGKGQGIDADPLTGDVFVFGRESENGPHSLLRVVPSSGKFSTVITFEGNDVLNGVSAYDPVNKIYWLQTSSNANVSLYYGIDVIKSTLRWNIEAGPYDMMTIAWDPATKLMYGFGLTGNETTAQRAVITLNSQTGEFNLVATLSEFYELWAFESTVDWTNRILYGILQPSNSENAPYQLVGVNMKSGKVVTSPELCTGVDCPIAINMLNKPWH